MSKEQKVKTKLELARQHIGLCKGIVEDLESKAESEKDQYLWANYKIELADVKYRLEDMIRNIPIKKEGE